MKSLIVVVFYLFVASSVYGKELVIISDNNNSISFQKEKYYLMKVVNEIDLKSIGFSKVVILNERKISEYQLKEKEFPTKKSIKVSDNGLIDTLEKVVSGKYSAEDLIVFISSMDYKNKASKTDATAKSYNDAWITSAKSPIKKLIDNYPNTPFGKAKVIVLDPSHDVKYLKNRERFFSFLFAKFGGRLVYYGSLDGDKSRLGDYMASKKELHALFKSTSLNSSEVYLMLDDDVIQYELP
jgi:hypothetical protein